jgi:hypothetical protein
MEDDPFEPSGGGGRSPRRGGGDTGGGGILAWLPLLLSLFRGRSLLGLAVVAALWFFMDRGGCGGMGGLLQDMPNLSTGGFLDPRQFGKASIYEALADDDGRNPLPESASLLPYAPPVGNQGRQGSCVAWSSAYAARSILEAVRTGKGGTVYSPAFLYNQIGLEDCQGSYIGRAMEYMTRQGSVPFADFPYDEGDCTRQPDAGLVREAAAGRMRGFTRLTPGDRSDRVDLRAIREHLSQGAPVVIGMMVGRSFMQDMQGRELWTPGLDDRGFLGMGGHAMCVVGYDDRRHGGAFQLMNSWGPEWGRNGFAWVRYGDFSHFVREAYGLEPMPRAPGAGRPELTCEVGLVGVEPEAGRMVPRGQIPLRREEERACQTRTPLAIGSRFKAEVRNSDECHVYLFGSETDGSAYTLFPYPSREDPATTKYSAFCGISGYRLFPRDKSMTPDSVGRRDEIAVVVSKRELDWHGIQEAMNRTPGRSFRQRLADALPARAAMGPVEVTERGSMRFTVGNRPDALAWCVIRIDKR